MQRCHHMGQPVKSHLSVNAWVLVVRHFSGPDCHLRHHLWVKKMLMYINIIYRYISNQLIDFWKWHELTVNKVSRCSFTWIQTQTVTGHMTPWLFSLVSASRKFKTLLTETNFVHRIFSPSLPLIPSTNSPPLFPLSSASTINLFSGLACAPPPSFLPQLSSFFTPLSATINLISPPPSLCQRSFQKDFPSWDLDSLLQTATSPPGGSEPWRTMWRVSAKNCVTPFEFSVCAVWWAALVWLSCGCMCVSVLHQIEPRIRERFLEPAAQI